jgi:hypothetical protein
LLLDADWNVNGIIDAFSIHQHLFKPIVMSGTDVLGRAAIKIRSHSSCFMRLSAGKDCARLPNVTFIINRNAFVPSACATRISLYYKSTKNADRYMRASQRSVCSEDHFQSSSAVQDYALEDGLYQKSHPEKAELQWAALVLSAQRCLMAS